MVSTMDMDVGPDGLATPKSPDTGNVEMLTFGIAGAELVAAKTCDVIDHMH